MALHHKKTQQLYISVVFVSIFLRIFWISKKFKFSNYLQILLLDPKRSMNTNIFLKQFKESHSEIVAMIKEGDIDKIGPERLRGLQKILPVEDEVQCVYLLLLLKRNIILFWRYDQYLVTFAEYKIN